MILAIRVDDRLLHGQVAMSWRSYLKYEAIIIASDSAANDKIRSAALRMAKPDGVKIAIRTIDGTIELLNNPALDDVRVFVVTDNISSAAKIYSGVNEKPLLNIGGIQSAPNKEPITSYAYVTGDDVEILKSLEKDNVEIEFRLVPSDTPESLKVLLT